MQISLIFGLFFKSSYLFGSGPVYYDYMATASRKMLNKTLFTWQKKKKNPAIDMLVPEPSNSHTVMLFENFSTE